MSSFIGCWPSYICNININCSIGVLPWQRTMVDNRLIISLMQNRLCILALWLYLFASCQSYCPHYLSLNLNDLKPNFGHLNKIFSLENPTLSCARENAIFPAPARTVNAWMSQSRMPILTASRTLTYRPANSGGRRATSLSGLEFQLAHWRQFRRTDLTPPPRSSVSTWTNSPYPLAPHCPLQLPLSNR